MEAGTSGLLDKLKAGIWKILKKEQEESKKKQGKTENQEGSKKESWTDELRDLAPIDDVENFDTYEQVLNWAFKNEKAKNIALSGPYGSGKSSIIETYLKRHKEVEKSVLKVSMASFTNIGSKLEETAGNARAEDRIEVNEEEIGIAILKQMFYAVKPDVIPLSRYRRLHEPSLKDKLKIYFSVVFFIVLIMAALAPNIRGNVFLVFDKLLDKSHFNQAIIRIVETLSVSLIGSVVIYLLYRNHLFRFHIKEVNLLSSISMKDESEAKESVFYRNIDEIVYFFGKTNYRTVLFEDLDRLNNTKIFVHLRVLNNLLNNNSLIGGKSIRFIYAVRDDMFTAEDRTKFFDFIIPVIPVTSPENSGGVLLKHMENIVKTKDGTITVDLRRFIVDIGPFIPDMRTLKNTCNEFSIYQNLLKEKLVTGSDVQRLLAMLIFKNSCPIDFADIQNGKGGLYRLFTHRDDIIGEMAERIRNKSEEKGREESEYEELVNQLKNMNVKQIFEAKELRRFWPKEFQENKLLIFMLRRGYINGSYMKYISYFEEGGITLADEKFILSVKNQEPLEPKYKIDNVERVAQQLLLIDYREEAARNYDLLNYLLSNDGNQDWNLEPVFYSRNTGKDESLKALIWNLAQWASESYEWKDFFDGFESDFKWKLIVLLATKWDEMLCCILGGELYKDYTGEELKKGLFRGHNYWDVGIDFSDEDKKFCIKEILEKCSVDVIQTQINEVNSNDTFLSDDLDQFLEEHKFDILEESSTEDYDIDDKINDHHKRVWAILGYDDESD